MGDNKSDENTAIIQTAPPLSMPILTILRFPDPRLHKVAQPVTVFTPELQTLIDDMLATMYDAKGIGLAATQINVHERLVLYKRLANCNDDDELDTMQEELIDRFGLLPEQGETLMACHRLRIAAKPLGINKIDASDSAIQLYFAPSTDLDPSKLIALLQRDRRCRMNGPDKLRVTVQYPGIAQRADFIKQLLKELA